MNVSTISRFAKKNVFHQHSFVIVVIISVDAFTGKVVRQQRYRMLFNLSYCLLMKRGKTTVKASTDSITGNVINTDPLAHLQII